MIRFVHWTRDFLSEIIPFVIGSYLVNICIDKVLTFICFSDNQVLQFCYRQCTVQFHLKGWFHFIKIPQHAEIQIVQLFSLHYIICNIVLRATLHYMQHCITGGARKPPGPAVYYTHFMIKCQSSNKPTWPLTTH